MTGDSYAVAARRLREEQAAFERARVLVEWEETGPDEDRAARLTARGWQRPDGAPALLIEKVPMHVEAYAVKWEERPEGTRVQVPEGEWSETTLDAIYSIDEGLGSLHTFIRNDREYVIVAYPYGD